MRFLDRYVMLNDGMFVLEISSKSKVRFGGIFYVILRLRCHGLHVEDQNIYICTQMFQDCDGNLGGFQGIPLGLSGYFPGWWKNKI